MNYIQNRSPTRALKLKTPEEGKVTRVKPNIEHVRVRGCIAYCYIPNIKRNKISPKAIPTIFIGYDEQSKAYHSWNPNTKRIIISRNIRFLENVFDLKVPVTSESSLDNSYLDDADLLSPQQLSNAQQTTPSSPPITVSETPQQHIDTSNLDTTLSLGDTELTSSPCTRHQHQQIDSHFEPVSPQVYASMTMYHSSLPTNLITAS